MNKKSRISVVRKTTEIVIALALIVSVLYYAFYLYALRPYNLDGPFTMFKFTKPVQYNQCIEEPDYFPIQLFAYDNKVQIDSGSMDNGKYLSKIAVCDYPLYVLEEQSFACNIAYMQIHRKFFPQLHYYLPHKMSFYASEVLMTSLKYSLSKGSVNTVVNWTPTCPLNNSCLVNVSNNNVLHVECQDRSAFYNSQHDPKTVQFVMQFKPVNNYVNAFYTRDGDKIIVYVVIPSAERRFFSPALFPPIPGVEYFYNFKVVGKYSNADKILSDVQDMFGQYLISSN